MSRPPLYRRFLNHPPPLSDRAWAYWLMAMLVLMGMVLGAGFCVLRQDHTPHVTPPLLQQQLDSLEQRVRALEHQKEAP